MNDPIIAAQDQKTIQQYLQNLPHALLITSERGMDTQIVTDIFVRSEPSDVQIITPTDGKKSIGIEQIRTFIDTTRTYANRRRILVVRPAETMTPEAQNALLKKLEEPSDGLYIILETYAINDLLSTVISRCQTLTLHRTSPAQDAQLLDSLHITSTARQQILFLAAGRPSFIRELAQDPALFETYQQIAIDAKKITSEVTPDSLVTALAYSADRKKAIQLIDIVIEIARFQLQKNGLNEQFSHIFKAATRAESSLKHNGNAKLALITLAVR